MDELICGRILLPVCTDHGFLLGEHEFRAKVVQPFWNEIARTPLFLWDPRIARSGERCQALVQNIDWGPTLLEFFGVPLTRDMQGIPLTAAVTADHRLREAVLFGIHGGHVNVTDGRYLYMRAPVELANRPLYEYTLMPTHMRHSFAVEELQETEMAPPFDFTKGCPVMKIAARGGAWHRFGNLLYDQEADPGQQHPLSDIALEARMIELLVSLMRKNDAPLEQFERLGLEF